MSYVQKCEIRSIYSPLATVFTDEASEMSTTKMHCTNEVFLQSRNFFYEILTEWYVTLTDKKNLWVVKFSENSPPIC